MSIFSLFQTRKISSLEKTPLMDWWQKPQQRMITRVITLLVTLTFVFPYLTWAFEAHAYPASTTSILFHQQIVEIPDKYAATLNTFQGGEDRLVVHVQDLHCNFEVQTNIAHIIDYVAAKHNLKLVAIEGASLPINVTHISTFPNAEVRQETGKYFMRLGKMGGAEYYASAGKHPVWLDGVEDPKLYAASREMVTSFLNDESQGYVCDLRDMLDELKAEIYNPELLRLDAKKQACREGEISPLKYGVYLCRYGKRIKLELSSYPNLLLYVSKRRNVIPRKVELEQVYTESEQLDQAIRECLYTSDAQRQLDQLEERLDIMEKLLNISATPKELQAYRENPKAFQVKQVMDFIRQYNELSELTLDTDIYSLDSYLQQVRRFYQMADERSTVFVENTVNRMKEYNTKLAVLVTGGFHTDHVLKEMQARNISYLSLCPRITQEDLVNPYFALIRDRKTPLEKLLAKNQNILKLAPGAPQVLHADRNAILTEMNPDQKVSSHWKIMLNIGLAIAELLKQSIRGSEELEPRFETMVNAYPYKAELSPEWETMAKSKYTSVISIKWLLEKTRIWLRFQLKGGNSAQGRALAPVAEIEKGEMAVLDEKEAKAATEQILAMNRKEKQGITFVSILAKLFDGMQALLARAREGWTGLTDGQKAVLVFSLGVIAISLVGSQVSPGSINEASQLAAGQETEFANYNNVLAAVCGLNMIPRKNKKPELSQKSSVAGFIKDKLLSLGIVWKVGSSLRNIGRRITFGTLFILAAVVIFVVNWGPTKPVTQVTTVSTAEKQPLVISGKDFLEGSPVFAIVGKALNDETFYMGLQPETMRPFYGLTILHKIKLDINKHQRLKIALDITEISDNTMWSLPLSFTGDNGVYFVQDAYFKFQDDTDKKGKLVYEISIQELFDALGIVATQEAAIEVRFAVVSKSTDTKFTSQTQPRLLLNMDNCNITLEPYPKGAERNFEVFEKPAEGAYKDHVRKRFGSVAEAGQIKKQLRQYMPENLIAVWAGMNQNGKAINLNNHNRNTLITHPEYGKIKDIASTNYPWFQDFESYDPVIRKYTIAMLESAGINAIVLEYCAGMDQRDMFLPAFINALNQSDRSFALSLDTRVSLRSTDVLKSHLKFLLDTYATQKSALQINGLALVFLHNLDLMEFTDDDIKRVVEELEAEGYVFILAGDKTGAQWMGANKLSLGFGNYNNQMADIVKKYGADPAQWQSASVANIDPNQPDSLGITLVYPGYDNRFVGGADTYELTKGEPKLFPVWKQTHKLQTPDSDLLAQTVTRAMQKKQNQFMLISSLDGNQTGTELFPSLQKGCDRILEIARLSAAKNGHRSNLTEIIRIAEQAVHDIHQRRGESVPQAILTSIQKAYRTASRRQPEIDKLVKSQESSAFGFIKAMLLSLGGALITFGINVLTDGYEGLLQAGVWGLLVFFAYSAVKWAAIKVAQKNRAKAMADEGKAARPPTLIPALQGYKTFKADADQERRGVLDTVTPEGDSAIEETVAYLPAYFQYTTAAHVWLHQKLHLPEFFAYLLEPIVGSLWMAGSSLRNRAKRVTVGTVFLSGIFILLLFMAPEQWNEACRATYGKQAKANQTQHNQVERIVRGYPRVFNSLNDVLATGKEKRDLDTYKQQSEADDKLADILRIINVQDLMSKAQVGTTIFAVLENEGSVFSFLKGRSLINLLKFLISANKLYWNIYTGVEKIKLYATPAQLQAAKELDLPINSYDIPWQKKVLILPKILAKKHARNTAVNIAPYDWANYFSLKASGQTLEQDHSAMLAHLKKQEADQDIRDNVMEHLELAAKNNLTILFETTVARESFVPLKKLSKSRHEYVRDQIRYVKALRKAWLKKHPDKKPPIGIVLDPWHLTGDMLGPKIKTWLKQGRSRQDIREKELLPLLIKFCDECDGLIAHIDIGNAAPWEIKFLPEELQRGRVMSPDSLVPNLAVIQYLMRTNPDIVNNITLDGSPQAPLMSTRAGKFTLGAIFAALAAFFVMLIKAFKRRLGSAGNDGFTLVEVAFAVTGVAIVVLGVVQPAVFSFAGLMAAVSVAMIAVPLILAIFVQMNKGSRISFSKSVKVGTQVALIICMFIVPSFWTRLYAQVGVDKKIEQVIVDPKRIINITDLFENSRSTGGKIYRQGDKVMIMGHEWCTLPFGSIRSGPIKIDFDSPRTIIKLNIETVTNGWYFIIHSPNLPVAPGGKYIKIWNDNSRKGIQIYDLKKLQRFGLTGEQEVQFEIGVTTYGREKVDNNTKVVLNVSSVLQEPSKATKRIKQRKTEITKTVRLSLADLFKNSNKTGVFLTQQGNQLIIKGDEWCFNTFGSIRSKPIKIDFNSSPGIRLNILDVTHEWYLIVHSPDLADFVKIWPDNSRTGTLTYDLTQLGLEGTKEITLEFGVSSYNTPGHKKVNEQNTVVVIDAQTQLTGVVPTGYIGTEKQAKSKTELTQYFTKSGLHKSLKGGLKSTVQAALVRDQIFKYARIEGNKIYIHAVNWWERPGKGADHWSWYGHYPKIDSTDIASVYHPLLGLYDSSDEEYMEWVIEVLMDMGVDGMNVDYYAGTREHDKWLAKLFEVVEKVNKKNPLGRKFELAVMYETKIIRENYGFADRGVLKEHIKRVLNTYALSPAYQRVAGVPVIYVFGMATTGFQGEDYRQIALELEKEGYIYLLVGDKTYESQYLGDKAAAAVHQWIDMWGLMNMPEVAKLSRDVTKLEARHHALLRTAREMKRVDIMGIAAVYNEFTDKKLGGGDWGRGVHRFLDSRGGDYFEQGDVFKETMKYAIENQDWLLWTLLITWDDWHEGTQMEPSLEKGFSKFFGIMEFAAGYKGFKADPRAVIKRTEKYAHEIYGEKLPPQVNKIIKDALHYASQVDRKIEQKYRNYLKRQAGIEAAKKRHDAEAREKLKAHPFRAAWGFIFGAISGVLSLVLIGLSIYLGTGLDNSLLVLAGIAVSTLFGLYFAMATLGFVRTGRAVYKVMYQSLHQDNPGAGRWTIAWKAFTGAIAWSNGILGNEKAFRILQKEYPKEADRVFYHEQFKNHFIGMLVMFPFVQNYLERKVVQAFLKAPGPLQVESKIQSYVWGQPAKDSFIIRFLNRALNKKQMDINIAELWFGAHKKNPGVVRIAGLPMALDRFAKAVGEPLLGKGRMEIGQLFKILDAKEPFSMQMHERFKPDSKNESWMVVIDRDRLKQEDKDQTIAEIHLGFRPIAEIDDKILPKFRKEYEALHTKAAKIVYFKTQYANVLKKGRTDKEGKEIKAFSNKLELRWENGVVEAYFNGKKQSAEIKKKLGLDDDMLVMNVPGATVHATSYGLIYEVQETCDKTLRLYDQGRNDPNRPLHIEEALEKLDFTPRPLSDYLVKPVELNERTRNLIRTPLYSMDQISLETQPSLDKDTGDDSAVVKVDGYQMLMVKDGEGQLCYSEPDGTEREIQLRRGDTLIVPAFMNSYTLFSKSRLTVLKAYEASAQEITEAQGLRGGKSLWEEDGFFEAPGVEKEEGPESAIKAEMLRLQRILPKPLNVPIRGLRELPVRIMQYLVRSILFANDRSTGGHPNLGLPLQAAAGIVLAGIFLLQSTVAVFACLPGTEPVGTISNTPRVEAFKRSTLIADDVMAGRFNIKGTEFVGLSARGNFFTRLWKGEALGACIERTERADHSSRVQYFVPNSLCVVLKKDIDPEAGLSERLVYYTKAFLLSSIAEYQNRKNLMKSRWDPVAEAFGKRGYAVVELEKKAPEQKALARGEMTPAQWQEVKRKQEAVSSTEFMSLVNGYLQEAAAALKQRESMESQAEELAAKLNLQDMLNAMPELKGWEHDIKKVMLAIAKMKDLPAGSTAAVLQAMVKESAGLGETEEQVGLGIIDLLLNEAKTKPGAHLRDPAAIEEGIAPAMSLLSMQNAYNAQLEVVEQAIRDLETAGFSEGLVKRLEMAGDVMKAVKGRETGKLGELGPELGMQLKAEISHMNQVRTPGMKMRVIGESLAQKAYMVSMGEVNTVKIAGIPMQVPVINLVYDLLEVQGELIDRELMVADIQGEVLPINVTAVQYQGERVKLRAAPKGSGSFLLNIISIIPTRRMHQMAMQENARSYLEKIVEQLPIESKTFREMMADEESSVMQAYWAFVEKPSRRNEQRFIRTLLQTVKDDMLAADIINNYTRFKESEVFVDSLFSEMKALTPSKKIGRWLSGAPEVVLGKPIHMPGVLREIGGNSGMGAWYRILNHKQSPAKVDENKFEMQRRRLFYSTSVAA